MWTTRYRCRVTSLPVVLLLLVFINIQRGHVHVHVHAQVQAGGDYSVIEGIVNPSSWSLLNSLIVAYRVESRATSSSVLSDDGTSSSTSTAMVTSTATNRAAISTSMTGTGTTHGLASQTTLEVNKAKNAQEAQEKMSLKYYDFGVSDLPFSSSLSVTSSSLYQFPLFVAPIVITYRHVTMVNLSLPPIVFDLKTLARIFRGNITMWNDAAIQATNPTAALPNQPITVILQAGPSAASDVLSRTFAKVDPDWVSSVGVSPGVGGMMFSFSWFTRVGSRVLVVEGSSGVVEAVVQNPYSITYSFLTTAQTYNLPVASVINAAGAVILPSVTAAALSAVELRPPMKYDQLTSWYDMSNPLGNGAWPFTVMTTVIIDKSAMRTTCEAKTEMLDFVLWLYDSATVDTVVESEGFGVLSGMFEKQFKIKDTIKQKILCPNGALAAPTSSLSTGVIVVSSQLQAILSLYLNVDARSAASSGAPVYSGLSLPSIAAIQSVLAGETDAAFGTPQLVEPDQDWNSIIKQEPQHIRFLPAFLTSMVPLVNLDVRLSSVVGNFSAPLYPITLDMELLAEIFTGRILTWTHPRIAAINPGLQQRYTAMAMGTTVSHNITTIYCCKNPLASTRSTIRAIQAMNWTRAYAGAIQFPYDVNAVLALRVDGYHNNPHVRIADYEAHQSSISAAIPGSISFASVTSYEESDSRIRLLPRSRSGETDPELVSKYRLLPTQASMLKCTHDTFNPDTLALPVLDSKMDECYPITHGTHAIIPARYSGAACIKGNYSLSIVKWLLTTPTLSDAAATAGVVRVTDRRIIHDAVMSTLENIRCDGETMLITLPIIWNLSSGIQAFVYAAVSIGWIAIICIFCFMMKQRGTTVFRSASVPSMTLILCGLSLILGGCFGLVSPPSSISCASVLWLGSLGFTLTFVPLFMKTWRIYKIFDRKALHVVKISNKKLNAMIAGLVACDLLLLIIWQSTAPLEAVVIERVDNNRIHQSTQCQASSKALPLIVITIVTKAVFILFGALMSFTTRKVATTFNESQTVAWAIYNFIFSVGIIIPIMVFVQAREDAYILLQLFLALWIAYATLGLLFGPKIAHIVQGDEAALHAENSSSRISSNGFSFISAVNLSRQVLAKYIQALEIQLQAAKVRMRELVGGKGNGSGHGTGTGSTGSAGVGVAAVSGVMSTQGGSMLSHSEVGTPKGQAQPLISSKSGKGYPTTNTTTTTNNNSKDSTKAAPTAAAAARKYVYNSKDASVPPSPSLGPGATRHGSLTGNIGDSHIHTGGIPQAIPAAAVADSTARVRSRTMSSSSPSRSFSSSTVHVTSKSPVSPSLASASASTSTAAAAPALTPITVRSAIRDRSASMGEVPTTSLAAAPASASGWMPATDSNSSSTSLTAAAGTTSFRPSARVPATAALSGNGAAAGAGTEPSATPTAASPPSVS